ncbi:MAG: DUF1854 domain-containing protein [Ruminococcaceae bacterium]|nr:DUF1854 domain-containing protein [Oscillospiraceae bacterium]
MNNELINDPGAAIVRLTKENASFFEKNGFLCLTVKNEEELTCDRVFLHRDFPFELLWEYISVLDADNKEIGLIYNISDFDSETEAMLKKELERKYYSPVIISIDSLKERYGFSYWGTTTAEGRKIEFTIQDTFRHVNRIGEDKCVITDVDGNRFVIESLSGLDKKSYRRIELYL